MTSNSSFEERRIKLQQEIERINLLENDLYRQLNTFSSEQIHVDAQIETLIKSLPTLQIVQNNAKELVDSLNKISESSDNISSKIKQLEEARCKVDKRQQRVGDLIDLDLCCQGVQTAIRDEDYEKGAAHIHRFMSMDQSFLQRTAQDESENTTTVASSVKTLQEATAQLQAIIKHQFDESVKKEDLSSIERFFKIFPLLGMHEEGINKFCTYLCAKLQETSKKNLHTALDTNVTDKRYNVLFADTITLLFEGIARIIEIHHPLIETYYGPGRLQNAIIIWHKECDRQIKRIILEFTKHRQINKKISQITENTRMSNSSSFSKIDKIDPKDLDLLIGEITIMHSRAEMYIRFIRRRIVNDLDVGVQEEQQRIEKLAEFDNFIKSSELSQCKHELLAHYLRFEQYFMEESVGKAVSMDSLDEGQQTSSMVDDVFFIIRKCIRRSISSNSLDGVCAVINNACGVLEADYCNILRGKLRQGYPSGYMDLTQAYNALQTSIQQGRLQPGDTEQSRTAFIVALNNADISIEYVETLCDSVLKEILLALPGLTANEKGKLESCLSGLSSVTTNLRAVIDFGMQQLRSSVIKPRINPWVDSFLTYSHEMTEDDFSAYEAGESFVQTLITNLDSLLSSFKEIITASNYDALVGILTTDVTVRIEKVIMKSVFNRVGGLVLDKEIRALSSYLTTATSWSVRDKFARLTQIATILNLERVSEIFDYWGSHNGALTWRLTPSELRTTMALRSDFKIEDIRRLKL